MSNSSNADLDSGEWTKAEQDQLSNMNLSKVGFQCHLNDCVILNPGTVSVSQKTMATTMEAIFGAVFKDGGADALDAVLVKVGLTDHEFLRPRNS